MEALRLENLSKYYTQSSVVLGLDKVSLSFDIGEFVAITGESGSGKSTLAHVISGKLPYEAGEMYVNGNPTSHYDLQDWEIYRRDTVAFISQSYGILLGASVLDNVESAMILYGCDKDEARNSAEQILASVDLLEYKNRRADKLSSGQKQRLSIARALAKPSKILVADEPTGNLDAENSRKIIDLLKEASKDRLVILITHDFEEAKYAVTRRVMLSDGAVVTDSKIEGNLSETATVTKKEKKSEEKREQGRKNARGLGSYVAHLILKSRPVFSAIVCLLLAFTSFVTFAFLGTFIVALDPSSTKIYSSNAFINGERDRLVVMKDNGEDFTEDDYSTILGINYVNSIEKRGYISDINYYYRPEIDYHSYTELVNGPNYHPVLNPQDYIITEGVKFLSSECFMHTLPLAGESVITAGRAPVSCYEVVSADPDYKTGDTLRIYIKNAAEWGASAYISAEFTVVGESATGSGLYFSDKLASALISASQFARPEGVVTLNGSTVSVLILPYDPKSYKVTDYVDENGNLVTNPDLSPSLPDDAVCMGEYLEKFVRIELGNITVLKNTFARSVVTQKARINAPYSRLVLVGEEIFDSLVDLRNDNQISLNIKDYAYADRVMNTLGDLGYISVSPFRLGSAETDRELANERMITLGVSIGSLILIFVLQFILLKAMFSSLSGHFRLMSDIGLTSKTAYKALLLILVLFAIIGEMLGCAAVLLLNGAGVERINGIFKYLESGNIVLLFLAHIVSVAFAFASVVTSIKKSVFASTKRLVDIDIEYSGEENE